MPARVMESMSVLEPMLALARIGGGAHTAAQAACREAAAAARREMCLEDA